MRIRQALTTHPNGIQPEHLPIGLCRDLMEVVLTPERHQDDTVLAHVQRANTFLEAVGQTGPSKYEIASQTVSGYPSAHYALQDADDLAEQCSDYTLTEVDRSLRGRDLLQIL